MEAHAKIAPSCSSGCKAGAAAGGAAGNGWCLEALSADELAMLTAIAESACRAYASGVVPAGTKQALAALFPGFAYIS